MIQDKAKKKAEIVSFFEKFGLEATISAFKTSKSSIYQWRKTLNENRGNIESLNELSKAPHCSRKSKIDLRIKDFIQNFRAEHQLFQSQTDWVASVVQHQKASLFLKQPKSCKIP